MRMKATYTVADTDLAEAVQFNRTALEGGVNKFRQRVGEALKDLMEQIQNKTREKTLSLLGKMNLPEDLKKMAIDEVNPAASHLEGKAKDKDKV